MSRSAVPEWDEWAKAHPPTGGPRAHRRERAQDGLSYEARITQENARMIASGRHPMTKVPLREPAGETCGTCANLTSHSTDKTFYKCRLVPVTFGPRTDVRLKWPACQRWSKSS